MVGEGGEASVRPLLPALANHRALQPVGAVDAAMEGIAFQAPPRVPAEGSPIAVEIRVVGVVVVLLAADDHAVADERAQATHVRIVGSADPGEGAVEAILVAVNLLPTAIGVVGQRIGDGLRFLGKIAAVERPHGQRPRGAGCPQTFQEIPPAD